MKQALVMGIIVVGLLALWLSFSMLTGWGPLRMGHHMMGMHHESRMRSMHGTTHRDPSTPRRERGSARDRRPAGTREDTTSVSGVDRRFVLETSLENGMGYVMRGENGGSVFNPTLRVRKGDVVQIRLVNTMRMPHDLAIKGLDRRTEMVERSGQTAEVTFRAESRGNFEYYCTVPGHRQAGMRGTFVVE